MDFDSTGKLIQISLAYKVMPIFEFAALFFVVFIAYFAVPLLASQPAHVFF